MLISQSRYSPIYGTDKGKRMFYFSSVFLIPNVDVILLPFGTNIFPSGIIASRPKP